MNNVFVYCEIEGTQVQEVSQELLTKGRKLANELNVELHAVVAGTGIKGKVEDQILPYGVDKLFVFDGEGLFPYTSAPHTDILVNLFKEEQPQICLMGATVIGRDLGPRVSSSLTSGLTADCTELEIGPYEDKKAGKVYENLLYQIRPAFGGNIVATIVNPEHRPQMATVRSGVMQKAIYEGKAKNDVVYPEVSKYVDMADAGVDCREVHVNDILALCAVGLDDLLLQILHGIVYRKDLGDREEAGLHDHVDTAAESEVLCDMECVEGEELRLLLCDLAL
jgi:electron transfer flavoprotein alpha subunit